MQQFKSRRILALTLALSMLLTSCGGGGTAAATMHLRKTEGTVGVSDGEGKDIEPMDNLGLYSGYGVDTRTESYAWIDLDDVKLTKLDQDSEIEITKEGKKLEIEVKTGSLFFNVTEPLDDDESMNIRTSTMLVGIRGTCGWVTEDAAALLEGTVEVTAGDQAVTVNAGEMAVYIDGELEVKPFSAASVPAFVKEELEDDDDLAEEIKAASGIDVTASLEETYRDVFRRIVYQGGEVLFAEEIDFEQDGSPELLIIYRDGTQEGVIVTNIYQKGMERSEQLTGYNLYDNSLEWEGAIARVSLVESEGRPYVLCYSYIPEGSEFYVYLGSLAQNDGDNSYWGAVDRVSWYHGTDDVRHYLLYERNEQGLAHGVLMERTAGDFEAIIQKYTEVRVLLSVD